MDYIISPDQTIFDIDAKLDELSEYIASKVVEEEITTSQIRNSLSEYYSYFYQSLGKSEQTFLLAVTNLATAVSLDKSLEQKQEVTKEQKSNLVWMYINSDRIKKAVKRIKLKNGAEELLKVLSNTPGKIIYYGNSTDELDEDKALQLRDRFKSDIFDDIYNVNKKDKKSMQIIMEEENLDEDTVFITAKSEEAIMAKQEIGMDVYYLNNIDHTKQSYDNFRFDENKIDFESFEHIYKMLNHIYSLEVDVNGNTGKSRAG